VKLHEFLLEAKNQPSTILTRGEQEFLDDVLKVCKLANAKASKYYHQIKIPINNYDNEIKD
jgi:hypothetical protein